MAFSLVLFDQDGCTAILKTNKLQGKDDEQIRRGLVCTTLWQKTSHKVEVIEVSDSNTYLNQYEDEWATSHRALELDRVKAIRGERACDGYLDVWPQEMYMVNEEPGEPISTNSQLSHVTTKKRKDNTQNSKNTPAKKTVKRSVSAKNKNATIPIQNTKEKVGMKGRKVVVHFEGSGEYQEQRAIPGRSPFYINDLTEDQVDVINQEIQQHLAGKSCSSTQTDTVAVITPEDIIQMNQKPTCDKSTWTRDITDIKLDSLEKSVRDIKDNQRKILDILERLDRRGSIPDFHNLIGDASSSDLQEADSVLPTIVFDEDFTTITNEPLRLTPEATPDVTSEFPVQQVIPTLVTKAIIHMDATRDDVCEEPGEVIQTMQGASPSDDVQPITHLDVSSEATPPISNLPVLQTPIRRRKVSKCQIPCGTGAVVEIESTFDMVGVPTDAEVRIKPVLLQELRENNTPSGVFAWRIARQIYSRDEMRSRNVYGSRGRQALSPRRAHALEHSVIDIYGAAELAPAVASINTGIRNISYRERKYANRGPLSSVENCL